MKTYGVNDKSSSLIKFVRLFKVELGSVAWYGVYTSIAMKTDVSLIARAGKVSRQNFRWVGEYPKYPSA